ncbi:uncharacterized protein LOC100502391 [Zea mays]|jgi:hypothetical protein|uniref:Uncharacterized protein n=1 Tax=Zea mays TaxID=4577 RepID=C4JAY6_MAIZE|nr:uncharacterized protein LOC100502391 [Zea mays]ACR38336.1 unknown [Zea mays]|eukprot:NP_001183798.1 uncharacterized protein LOC100502391 [Zea mays]
MARASTAEGDRARQRRERAEGKTRGKTGGELGGHGWSAAARDAGRSAWRRRAGNFTAGRRPERERRGAGELQGRTAPWELRRRLWIAKAVRGQPRSKDDRGLASWRPRYNQRSLARAELHGCTMLKRPGEVDHCRGGSQARRAGKYAQEKLSTEGEELERAEEELLRACRSAW